MSKIGFTVDFCEKKSAKEYMLPRHYSGTWNTNFGVKCVALYLSGQMVGCAVFGRFMNQNSYTKLHQSLSKDNCLELNRLFVDDDLSKNIESWFIARCMRLLKACGIKCVQSFSDGRLGCGVVYQAANFDYYGYHKTKFIIDKLTGKIAHKKVMENSNSPKAMAAWLLVRDSGNMQMLETSTFRYLFWVDKSMRKDCLLKAQAYPKQEKCFEVWDVAP